MLAQMKLWRLFLINPPVARLSRIRLYLIFIALTLLVPLVGIAFVSLQVPKIEQATYDNLQAIAKLKSEQIEYWLTERNGDGKVFMSSAGINAQIYKLIQRKADTQAFEAIANYFQSLLDNHSYSNIHLLDTQGHLLLTQGENSDVPLDRQDLDLIALSMTSKQVQRNALYRDEMGNAHLDWAIPVLIANAEGEHVVAVILMRVSADQFLYPLIQTWPIISASAETLLVRHDGKFILYLNELRHRHNSALTLKLPDNNPRLAAAVAVNTSVPGINSGLDYRGVEVLAAYRPIAGTDWHIVAKVDRDEVLAPLWHTLYWIGFIALFAVVAIMLAVWLVWRQQQRMQQLELQAQQSKTEKILQYFFDLPFIGMAIISPETKRCLQCNHHLCNMIGYTQTEITEINWVDITHPEDINLDNVQFERIVRAELEGYAINKRFIHKDGATVYTRMELKGIHNPEGSVEYILATIEDITLRTQIEAVQLFLAKTGSGAGNESFFSALARFLAENLCMDFVCIDRLDGDGLTAHTVAVWCDGHFEDNVTYALKDTPCGDVVGKVVCCFPASVTQYFPKDQVLQDLRAESYFGVTLWGNTGQPIGLIALIGRRPLANASSVEAILKLVAQRAAGELEHLEAEKNLHLAASVFSHAREGILITQQDATIIDVNEAFTRITGYSRDDVIGKNPRMLSSCRQNKAFYTAFWHDLIEKGHWYGEIWNRHKSGEVYAVIQTISAVYDNDGKPKHYVALFSDITLLKLHEQKLEHIAHYDPLTNVPNRVLLNDRLRQCMAQAVRQNQRLAVAFIDIDGFKAINDNHGHEAGDQLLITLAARMKDALREDDTIARFGGDEFVAVLVDLADDSACMPLITRLLAVAAQPVEFGNIALQVSASLGITFYPQMEKDIDAKQLLHQADQAMYQAKLAGKNGYSIFDANGGTTTISEF